MVPERAAGFWVDSLHDLRTGWMYFGKSLQSRATYNSAYLWDVVSSLVSFSIVFFVWHHVTGEGRAVRGLSRETLFSYLILAYSLNFGLGMWMEGVLGRRVRMGLIATDLLKPVDFQWMYFFMSLGFQVPQVLIGCALLGLGCLLFPIQPLAGFAEQPFLCLASLILADLVQYGICFCFALGAFVTQMNYGIFFMRNSLHFIFSGLMAPLLVMGTAMASWSQALPFSQVVYAPASLFLGWATGPEAWQILARQALWALGLFVAGRLILAFMVRRLVIQGG